VNAKKGFRGGGKNLVSSGNLVLTITTVSHSGHERQKTLRITMLACPKKIRGGGGRARKGGRGEDG